MQWYQRVTVGPPQCARAMVIGGSPEAIRSTQSIEASRRDAPNLSNRSGQVNSSMPVLVVDHDFGTSAKRALELE